MGGNLHHFVSERIYSWRTLEEEEENNDSVLVTHFLFDRHLKKNKKKP